MALLPMKEVINTKDPREVIFFVVSGMCGLILLFIAGWIVVGLVASDSKQSLSGPVTLSSNWLEIFPQKPIRVAKQYQDVVLDLDLVEGSVKDNPHLDRMQLSSGVLVQPEIQLFDQNGNVFTASVENFQRNENSILWRTHDLPSDRTYIKLRIRNEKPVRLSRVVWHCWNGK
jgi:hypothetical protein